MRKNNIRSLRLLLALVLALALCTGAFGAPARAASWFWDEEKEDALTVVDSAIADDGLLRVSLKSLGAPQTLDLTLAGVYTVEHNAGFRFARGTRITLAAEDGNVMLSVGGLTLSLGPAFTLTRQQAEDGAENGIYIEQSEKETLYCGDLAVSVQGGALQAILHIQIEDYLYGVVAYEMSDSFPLEALKAQAVAARTYAMGRKWVSAGRDWDVVDTTADQVYKGFDPAYENVIAAVDATRGIVGTYNGGFATCYYTASNGGQTALPTDIWSGDGDYGYLDTRDDPYDLENPSSLVNSMPFRDDLSDCPALSKLLKEGLVEAAHRAGLDFEEIRLERVAAIEPIAPKRPGSRMYQRLRFQLEVSTRSYAWQPGEGDTPPALNEGTADNRDALLGLLLSERLRLGQPYVYALGDWTPAEQPVPVELTVYTQIKKGLSLGLSSLDCELVSVVTDADAGTYALEMRRFGHGVGMSQRGAQQMAGAHDFGYLEILAFYYPGMTLERIAWPEPELTAVEALPLYSSLIAAPTPKPTPAPLPQLEAGERYARVRLESAASTLNLRETPATTARVLDVLANGRELIVMEEVADGWAHVRTAELEGYVKLEYLELEQQ